MAINKYCGEKGVQWDHPCAAHPTVKDAENGIVVVEPKRTKVAIVGFASSSTMDAPFHDPEYEIWIMNQLYRFVPRADRQFEMHERYWEYVVEGTDYIGYLKECPIPIYMTQNYPEYPNSVKFPLDRLSERFGRYWTSTIAFMLALAIDEGFERIDLFGIDLSVGTEYTEQRPCAERLIGYADALGITVGIPVASSLCKGSHIYGYEKDPINNGLFTEEDLHIRRSKLTAIRDEKITQLNQVDGALAEVGYLIDGLTLRARQATWNP
jgi:hypothetical protein